MYNIYVKEKLSPHHGSQIARIMTDSSEGGADMASLIQALLHAGITTQGNFDAVLAELDDKDAVRRLKAAADSRHHHASTSRMTVQAFERQLRGMLQGAFRSL